MPEQEDLVRETWPLLAMDADRAAARFYGRLFEIAPDARALFAHVDMQAQGEKFMQMLEQIVGALDQAPVLVSDVAALARRHNAYGAEPGHYASVGAALVWAIEETLGPKATPEVSAAWRAAYTLVAAVMGRAAARGGAAAPPPR